MGAPPGGGGRVEEVNEQGVQNTHLFESRVKSGRLARYELSSSAGFGKASAHGLPFDAGAAVDMAADVGKRNAAADGLASWAVRCTKGRASESIQRWSAHVFANLW